MSKLLVAILTSEKLEKLERCIQSVIDQTDKSNVVVIVNTLDDRYANLATYLADSYGIKSVITNSIGKPGRGKNELVRYFLTTDYTHVIPVDGDDMLLPNALEKLTSFSTSDNDVVGLIDGLTLLYDQKMSVEDWQKTEIYLQRGLDSIDPKNYKKFNLHIAKIRRTSIEYGNLFNRFILISKKAAELINYDEVLAGAEDIKQGLFLKLAHHEGLINYILLSSQHIYLYDVTDQGVFFNTLCKSDPDVELKRFWYDLSNEQINILRSFQLECVHD